MSILTSLAFMCRVVNSRIILIATFVLRYLGASKARLRGTMCTRVKGSTFVEDIFALLSGYLDSGSEAYLNPSLVLLQVLCFWFALTFLLVLAMTQVGTEEFCFLAFMRRFFLDASLFLPMSL